MCRRGLQASPGPIDFDVPDLTTRACGDLAVAWGLDRIVGGGVEIRSRGTRVFRRRDGDWQMIHQHLSVPAPGD
ncbi:nuclear transport factor 2 family protein [Actinosynnema sp. NPDC059797]